MNTSHGNCTYRHSDEFFDRRRALFPSDENSNDGLGPISPLSFDSNSDDEEVQRLISDQESSKISDYDIIGVVGDNKILQKNTINCLSLTSGSVTPSCLNPTVIEVLNTPCTESESPTQKHKTPHDHHDSFINATNKAPKLVRKYLESSVSDIDVSPIQNQQQSLSSTNSKVRTALFPELNMSLSPKSFYPKSETAKVSRVSFGSVSMGKKKVASNKNRKLFLCNRKKQFGQINAGVKHGIKKPKKSKNNIKSLIIQAACNIIDNSPLNDYLNDLNEINNKTQVPNLRESIIESKPEEISRKRSLSPIENTNRKFFKSSKPRATVTLNKNLKFEVNNGKMSLIEKSNTKSNKRKAPLGDDFDMNDVFLGENEPLLSNSQMDTILNQLDNDKENNPTTKEIDVLLSPTSQMCDMTSGLAINSPKKAINLTPILDKMPQPKLFSVFYPNVKPAGVKSNIEKKIPNNALHVAKKFKHISKDQMLLDAGQKKFGLIQCPECQFLYHVGDPTDEITHLDFHNDGPVFRFRGWKNERVVCDNLLEGRIIQILPTDSKIWWKKVKDVLEVVDRHLGYFDIKSLYDSCQVFLYIKNKTIVGVLVAESKTTAHRLLTSEVDDIDLCSEESYPIKCGVARVWVHQNCRKRGVASALMNTLKNCFVFGLAMKNEDIALSSPTLEGKLFGKNYFKTSNFLIYHI